jgi:hypothetical protein
MRALLIALLLCVASPALADIEYLGTTTRWGWTQPSGSPDGWKVYVSRNGGPFIEEEKVSSPEATVSGQPDETIQLKVSATLGPYETALSAAGELVTLRVIDAPTGVLIRCPEGESMVDLGNGWWTCQ